MNDTPADCVFESLDSPLFEFSDADGTAQVLPPQPPTAAHLLHLMRERIKYYGVPLPDGYVPPPGVDIAALLKQVPWPPAA